MCKEKDSLIGEGKRGWGWRQCKGNHIPPPTSRPIPSHSPSNGHLGSQNPSFLLFFYCTFYYWVCCEIIWNIPLGSSDHLSWLCPLWVSLGGHRVGIKEGPDAVQALFSNSWNIGVLSKLFKQQTQSPGP